MELQNLIINIIDAMGGVSEFTEYALANVLLPERYMHRFNGRTELTLAFDYEVAEEHPEADFITFGSEVMETLLDLALNTPLTDTRFIIVDRFEISDAKTKITNALGKRYSVEILSQQNVTGIWSVFVFRAHFLSSESFEEEHHVWINMLTGEVDMGFAAVPIFFESEPITDYPYASTVQLSEAYARAKNHMEQVADKIAKSLIDNSVIVHEEERLQYYYEDLIEENLRRLTRKGITPEREADIMLKNDALKIEMTRQINEIQENLTPRVSIELAHGISNHIPLIELHCRVSDRIKAERRTFYYECLTKRFFEPNDFTKREG